MPSFFHKKERNQQPENTPLNTPEQPTVTTPQTFETQQEQTREQPLQEQQETRLNTQASSATPAQPIQNGPQQQQTQPETRSETYKEIEKVLSEGLEGVFQTMDPNMQQAFKAKGEETVSKIEQLINTAKAKARAVLSLIKEWLKMIPHVNRFFLEQESKLKADKIISIAKDHQDQTIEKE